MNWICDEIYWLVWEGVSGNKNQKSKIKRKKEKKKCKMGDGKTEHEEGRDNNDKFEKVET